jgi:hypothetical protein
MSHKTAAGRSHNLQMCSMVVSLQKQLREMVPVFASRLTCKSERQPLTAYSQTAHMQMFNKKQTFHTLFFPALPNSSNFSCTPSRDNEVLENHYISFLSYLSYRVQVHASVSMTTVSFSYMEDVSYLQS